MKLINADTLVHIPIYDEQTEENILKEMSIADFLDTFADEGCPPAQPKRPKGKWIPHSEKCREYIGTVLVNVEYNYWFCDTCGYRVENGQPIHNFCPHCGADMRKRGEADG